MKSRLTYATTPSRGTLTQAALKGREYHATPNNQGLSMTPVSSNTEANFKKREHTAATQASRPSRSANDQLRWHAAMQVVRQNNPLFKIMVRKDGALRERETGYSPGCRKKYGGELRWCARDQSEPGVSIMRFIRASRSWDIFSRTAIWAFVIRANNFL